MTKTSKLSKESQLVFRNILNINNYAGINSNNNLLVSGSLENQAERMCLIMKSDHPHRPVEPDPGNAGGGNVNTVKSYPPWKVAFLIGVN